MTTPTDTEARCGYALCGDARAGSVFLTQLLASTDKLGRPWEFFHDSRTARRIVRDPVAALDHLARQAATPNGVYGLKVFTPHFDLVRKARWAERLPRLGFVHLTRRDLLGQAISLTRAVQTGRYKFGQAGGEPRYDRRKIADALARLAWGQGRWESWFARNGLAPLRLAYEEVVAAPQAAVDQIAALVGLAEPAPIDMSRVAVRVQRDVSSEEWRDRFLREAGDVSYLDGGRLFSRLPRGGAFARWFLGPR